MEEKVKISMLLEIYGKLLTEKQSQMLEDYYNHDTSPFKGPSILASRENLLQMQNSYIGPIC